MLNNKYKFISTLVFFVLLSPISLLAYTFERDLKVGSTGEDVKMLQIFLNTKPETKVAATGPGSSGNETLYFGPATHRAVVLFQEIYKAETLSPIGLLYGTGFVGPLTRAVLGRLSAAGPISVTPITSKEPSPSIQKGIVSFKNVFDETKDTGVYINELTPINASVESEVIIKGSGFDKRNTIYSVLGIIENVSASNGVIKFDIDDFPEIKNYKGKIYELKGLTVYVRVGTKNGVSTNAGYFVLSGN